MNGQIKKIKGDWFCFYEDGTVLKRTLVTELDPGGDVECSYVWLPLHSAVWLAALGEF